MDEGSSMNDREGKKKRKMKKTKTKVVVCMGSACFARGNANNLEFLENYIKENNLDINIELSGSRCEGKCAFGPNIIINDQKYTNADEDLIKDILKKL